VTAGSAFCMLTEETMDWIHLAQDKGHWLAVNMMNGNESMGCITWKGCCMELVNIWYYSF
jgi:hypothetical protein